MKNEDNQKIKVKVIPLDEISERMAQLLRGEATYEPLIILPGEYSEFIEKGDNDE